MNHEEAQELINDVENVLQHFLVERENNFTHISNELFNMIHGRILIPVDMIPTIKEQITILLNPLRVHFNIDVVNSITINVYNIDVWYHPKRILEPYLQELIDLQRHEPHDKKQKQIENTIEKLNNHREDLPKNYILK